MRFYPREDGLFESKLEIPDGNNPDQNAWLTLTIRYRLNFVDDWNEKAGITVERENGGFLALDGDKTALPIVSWDLASKTEFGNVFQRGEKIWNQRFVLITPQDYDGLDYESLPWKVRPNVLCLFRLVPAASPHLEIDVVRLDPSVDSHQFRSTPNLYDNGDVYRPTLGHELGHALGLDEIMVMKGDKRCVANSRAGRCYGETEEERANIMGSGRNITLICARPWLDSIADYTGRAKGDWTATLDAKTPPRKIPIGVSLVGEPARW